MCDLTLILIFPVASSRAQINWDSTPAYVAQSVALIGQLAQRYAGSPALLGFGLLNEPQASRVTRLHPIESH